MKILNIEIRGELYKVNTKGQLIRTDMPMEFHDSWRFLGISFHHWRNGIDMNLRHAFKSPEKLIGGLLWDIDHNTIRKWGGKYNGKLPRITNAYIV